MTYINRDPLTGVQLTQANAGGGGYPSGANGITADGTGGALPANSLDILKNDIDVVNRAAFIWDDGANTARYVVYAEGALVGMLEEKLGNGIDYQNLTDVEKGNLDQAILKLIALRTVNVRAGSQINERNQLARGLGAGIDARFTNISAGGKVITTNAGGISTRTLLDYVTNEIRNNAGAYGTVNGLALNAGAANQGNPVDFSFGKLAALETDAINA